MISSEEVPLLIYRFFKRIPETNLSSVGRVKKKSLVVDNAYSLVEKETLFSVIRGNPMLQYPAHLLGEEILDCDDFAMHLKASMTAFVRQKHLSSGEIVYPPAIGIVITQNHALNIVVTKWGERKRVFLIDSMMEDPVLVSQEDESLALLKALPIKFIYI